MNGDRWQLKDGQEALEVGRDNDNLRLAIITPNWPFPNAPILVNRKECTKLGSRYHNGAIPEEFEEAPF